MPLAVALVALEVHPLHPHWIHLGDVYGRTVSKKKWQ